MKSYINIEQSKILAKILPIESADMYYQAYYDSKNNLRYIPRFSSTFIPFKVDIPAWNLATLLDLLPNNEHIATTISRGSWKIDTVEYLPNTWWCEYEDTENQTEFNISADNPVDACVEMIIKLNELKML